MKNTIKIAEGDRNTVQRADIESSSLMNLITFMINHNVDITNERFEQYNEKYKQAFVEFEKAKNMIEKKYLSNIKFKYWNLDYDTCELIYEEI